MTLFNAWECCDLLHFGVVGYRLWFSCMNIGNHLAKTIWKLTPIGHVQKPLSFSTIAAFRKPGPAPPFARASSFDIMV
jgi:hypothetical protein